MCFGCCGRWEESADRQTCTWLQASAHSHLENQGTPGVKYSWQTWSGCVCVFVCVGPTMSSQVSRASICEFAESDNADDIRSFDPQECFCEKCLFSLKVFGNYCVCTIV